MKLSVNISSVMAGKKTTDAMELVHTAGYDAFEFWSWWDQDLDAVLEKKEALGLTLTSFCTRYSSLTQPEKHGEYREGLAGSLTAAEKLHVPFLISQTGQDTGAPREVQHKSIVDGLKACLPLLEKTNVTLLVEPLNARVDHIGTFLTCAEEAFDIVKAVNSPQVKVLFDLYHQQVTQGDILYRIEQNLDCIAHFHAAGVPGRHELYHSELDYRYLFKKLSGMGYQGYIGLEYFPADKPEEGLQHAKFIFP